MSITLKCHGCRTTLRVRDELAGRKVKCPRCQTILPVPEGDVDVEVDEEEPVAVASKQQAIRTSRTSRQPARGVQREGGTARKDGIRTERGRDEPREVPRRRKGDKGDKDSKYKPCPQCGAEGPKRVKWTAWGSFYGPALFSHVRCLECGYCYNGKTGRSNILAAAVFVTVPLLGILGIIGGIVYMLYTRGHLKF
jgi:predicted Zn finger-like uncharacterized protein